MSKKKKKRFHILKPKKLPTIHHEGVGIIISVLAVAALINIAIYLFLPKLLFYILLAISVVLVGGVINFFRSPIRRNDCGDPNMVYAPADGVIVAIEEVHEHEFFDEPRLMVSIFMNIFNVHANWYPVSGKILYTNHHSGRFMSAYLPKASTENERSMVVIEAVNGRRVMARQIAGAIARRIVTYAKPGDSVTINQHMGFIKFGSRVDIYLPIIGTELLIKSGDKTEGSLTPIARMVQKK